MLSTGHLDDNVPLYPTFEVVGRLPLSTACRPLSSSAKLEFYRFCDSLHIDIFFDLDEDFFVTTI